MRQRILDAVRQYPGIHLRELARQLDSSVALIEYHVPALTAEGLIEAEADQNTTRLYPRGRHAVADADRAWIALLRQPNPLHIAMAMLDRDAPIRHGDLCEALEMGKSRLSFHLRKLEAAGMVEKDAAGRFGLTQRERTRTLLATHPPTNDMVDRFATVWSNFYGGRT